jgi:signal transduction histidine kinase/ActR/RegA family two-component response regulator
MFYVFDANNDPADPAMAYSREITERLAEGIEHSISDSFALGQRISADNRAGQASVLRSIERVIWMLAAGSILGTLACAAAAWGFGSLMTLRIRELLATIERIGRGERIEHGVADDTPDELGSIGRGLLQMAAALDASRSELLLAKGEAEAASHSKSLFLANMSHEIRTPMTAILGYAEEIIERGDLTRIPLERLEAVNAIKRNGAHLLQIIGDILDISRIEAGRLNIEQLWFSPHQLLCEVGSLMRVQADARRLELSSELATPLPERIRSDPVRMRQILINLIGNAIKYTERGTVRLVTRLVGDASNARIRFDVIDSGIGMTPGELTRLFEPFTQGDDSATRTRGGVGLGLSICRRLLDLMGGELEVESRPGEGSAFQVTLPLGSLEGIRLVEDPARIPATGSSADGESAERTPRASLDCRVLLAEDSPDNQRLIRRLLERRGAQVHVVENGRLALESALGARDEGEPFDVVLMDMQMPVLDGYDATRALRRAGYELPVIALTAHAMPGDREKCLAAGCDDFATKPIDRPQLLELVARYAAEPKLAPDS